MADDSDDFAGGGLRVSGVGDLVAVAGDAGIRHAFVQCVRPPSMDS